MSHSRVSKALRERIEERDRHRCSYCLTPEAITGAPMELDHIIPESLGGPTEPENLCLACGVCNSHKAGVSPRTILRAALSSDSLIRCVRHGWNTWAGAARAIELRDALLVGVPRSLPCI